MKLEAKARLIADVHSQSSPEYQAVDWLWTYISSSFNMDEKYLTRSAVTKILAPLYQLVPKPTNSGKELLRVVKLKRDVEVGTTLSLPASRRVKSWTLFTSKRELSRIADEVGVLGEDHVYAVRGTPKDILVDPDWIKKLKVVLRKQKIEGRSVQELLAFNPNWQREVIVADVGKIQVTVVTPITYG